jgi:hypothetical protein
MGAGVASVAGSMGPSPCLSISRRSPPRWSSQSGRINVGPSAGIQIESAKLPAWWTSLPKSNCWAAGTGRTAEARAAASARPRSSAISPRPSSPPARGLRPARPADYQARAGERSETARSQRLSVGTAPLLLGGLDASHTRSDTCPGTTVKGRSRLPVSATTGGGRCALTLAERGHAVAPAANGARTCCWTIAKAHQGVDADALSASTSIQRCHASDMWLLRDTTIGAGGAFLRRLDAAGRFFILEC